MANPSAMLHFQTFLPSPALRNHLYCYLVSDVVDNNDFSVVHEALPMGITTLCFSDQSQCYSNRSATADKFLAAPDIAIVGQMMQKGETVFHRPSRSVVALFRVTGLFRLSGVPMNIVAGGYSTDATSVMWYNDLRQCREHMFQHHDPAKIVSVLDTFLTNKLKASGHSTRNLDKVATFIDHHFGDVNLKKLCDQASMSVKTLERHFAEKIGLTPKYFSRVIRFKHAFRQLGAAGKLADVMGIIDACGYTDQAHFIKEFQHFTGHSPSFYYQTEEVLTPFFLESASHN